MSTERLTEAWHDDRRYLITVANGLLHDLDEAEDAVQDAFARLAVQPMEQIRDARGWLVVVVRRIALDRLESARHRLTRPTDAVPETEPAADPVDRVTLDDEVRRALAVVLDQLSPAERTAFVLHDIFGLPFARVAELTGRTDAASRQLASRARRAVRDGDVPDSDATPPELVVVAERFVSACETGDLESLAGVLASDVWGAATGFGLEQVVTGVDRVARGTMHFLGPEGGVALSVVPLGDEVAVLGTRDAKPAFVVRLLVIGDRVHAIRVLPIDPAR